MSSVDEIETVTPSDASGGDASYFRVLHAYRVLLCTACGACYVRGNYQRHLLEVHRVKGRRKRAVVESLAEVDLAASVAEVVRPSHGQARVNGLRVHDGWSCNVGRCTAVSINRDVIGHHCSRVHRLNVKAAGVVSRVKLQTLFRENPQYFIVTVPEIDLRRPQERRPAAAAAAAAFSPSPPSSSVPVDAAFASLRQQLGQARRHRQARHATVPNPQHISEITPWLRRTQFHIHLGGLDPAAFTAAYQIPRADGGEAALVLICGSVDRVLRAGLQRLDSGAERRLHRVDRQLLNSFQQHVTSQVPLQRPQNHGSVAAYSAVFQKAVCFFFRVEDGEYEFERPLFAVTRRQRDAAAALMAEAAAQVDAAEAEEEDGDEAEERDRRLDHLTLAFCISLIQQRLVDEVFASPLLSFCAALAWQPSAGTWMAVYNYSSQLSYLVYDSQLLVLLHCDALVAVDPALDLSETIVAQRDEWLLNTCRGPLGEINSWRLYTMSVGRNTVHPATIRWYDDGVTLAYSNVVYTVAYLRDEMTFYLREARRLFNEDLCLGLPDVPVYRLAELVDNWEDRRPGACFVDDARNADALAGGEEWLLTQLCRDPRRADLVFGRDAATDTFVVRNEAAAQYEAAVQTFFEYVLVLMHKFSGEPGRRPEVLGLRWCNGPHDKRNLFLHDGDVLFILTYHKALHRTNASRFPVRFCLPAVGELVVQYLVLIQPFRELLARQTAIPAEISEYLFAGGEGKPWLEDRFTRTMTRLSRLSVGVETSVQAWRQICAGISVKWYSDEDGDGVRMEMRWWEAAAAEADEEDGARDEEAALVSAGPAALPAALHAQFSHTARVGNQAYGGTINFNGGLTDAGLQEYRRVSRWWHRFVQSPPQPRTRPPRSSLPTAGTGAEAGAEAAPALSHRRRPASPEAGPLPKRLACRRTPLRHRRRWTMEEAQDQLEALYGPGATYRSPGQRTLIEHILAGDGEIVAVLATNEGKSLAFLLPPRLRGAGTTVVVVPLVALRQDLVRRCAELGVQFAVWDEATAADEQRAVGCPLVFVAVETAVGAPFHAFLARLDAAQRLDRVILDEAHLVLTSSHYRPKMRLIRRLRNLRAQFVFLTGTLPPSMLRPFQQSLLLSEPTVIRSTTFRKDLRYAVERVPPPSPGQSFLDLTAQYIRTTLAQSELHDDATARVIVYSTTRDEVDVLAALLDCDVYYSNSGTAQQKAAVLERWRNGGRRVVVATSAFGMGVDYGHVRIVFHVGVPDDAVGFAQEVGRLGRDGGGGQSVVLLAADAGGDTAGLEAVALLPGPAQVMRTYVQRPRCHAAVLSRFLDGEAGRWYCDAEEAARRCGRCGQLGRWGDRPAPHDAHVEEDAAPLWAQGEDGERQTTAAAAAAVEAEEKGEKRREEENDDRSTASEISEEGEDRERDTDNGVAVGPAALRRCLRDQERGQTRYVQRLRQWQGLCMICRLLGGASGSDRGPESGAEWHSLDQCRHQRKGDFFQAKRQAVQQGRQRSGWIMAYRACFGCGNPQEVCNRPGSQRQRECEFKDIVFPASWAVFHMENRFGRSLEEIAGRPFRDEASWMRWLGEGCELHGMTACHAAAVTDWALQRLELP